MEKLLSVREAAELLGLRRSTVYKYTLLGVLPHVKPRGKRGRTLFVPSELEAWVRRHHVEATNDPTL